MNNKFQILKGIFFAPVIALTFTLMSSDAKALGVVNQITKNFDGSYSIGSPAIYYGGLQSLLLVVESWYHSSIPEYETGYNKAGNALCKAYGFKDFSGFQLEYMDFVRDGNTGEHLKDFHEIWPENNDRGYSFRFHDSFHVLPYAGWRVVGAINCGSKI